MPQKLVCYGDLCADILLQVSQVPLRGQDSIVEAMSTSAGGAAANCAICASRSGMNAEVLGMVGRDSLGERILKELNEEGVGVSHVRSVDSPTGVVIVAVDGGGERTMFSFRGANACEYGPLPEDLFAAGDCLYVSGYSFQTDHSRATAMELLRLAGRRGAIRVLDPSYAFARDARTQFSDALSSLDFLFPNQEEARLLSGSSNVEESAAIIRSLGPRVVVVTLGAAGCYIHSDEISTFVPAAPATAVIDTTGAGDAFCTGFLNGILRGMDHVSSARLGHQAAAEVIGVVGSHKTR